ncbi:MAG TPA: hypothetical protein VLE95_08180, partial [Chlamydiales bacterium]|nr:hypothetical protein [Chlamydiales bacterium]
NPAESYNPAEEVAFAMLFNSSCSSPSPNPTPFNLFNLTPPPEPLPPLQLFHSSSLFGAQEDGAASSSLLELPPASESYNSSDATQEDGAASSSLLDPNIRKCPRLDCGATTTV